MSTFVPSFKMIVLLSNYLVKLMTECILLYLHWNEGNKSNKTKLTKHIVVSMSTERSNTKCQIGEMESDFIHKMLLGEKI